MVATGVSSSALGGIRPGGVADLLAGIARAAANVRNSSGLASFMKMHMS
jgi:hypothetical protein